MKTLAKIKTSTGMTITVSRPVKKMKITALIGMSNGGRYTDSVVAYSYTKAVEKAKASAKEDNGYCGLRVHLISLTSDAGKQIYRTASGMIGVSAIDNDVADATFKTFEDAAAWADKIK